MKQSDRVKLFSRVALVVSCLLSVTASLGAADMHYHIVARYPVGGSGSFGNLRLDVEARRLYLAHGDRVEVLDADSGKKVGEIAPTQGVRDIALAPEFKHGFATNGAADSVTLFDMQTLKILKVIKLGGKDADAILYDGGSKRVFVAESAGGSVAALDPASGEVVGTTNVGGRLRQMATNGYGDLFVAAEDKNVIHVLDTHTLQALGDFPVGSGEGPTGLAIDPVGRRLFVACANGRLPIIDTDIGFTFEELPIGTGAARDTFTFSPQGQGGWKGAVFVASTDGTLTIEKMNAFISYSPGTTVSLPKGIRSVAFDPKTHRLFVPAVEKSASAPGVTILVVGE